ncbi:hypothetical protein AAVH_16461 [Aphelenchoides avenae]|nr:hypothetical protein AAVH_16461 [Aphelenchus avenae]
MHSPHRTVGLGFLFISGVICGFQGPEYYGDLPFLADTSIPVRESYYAIKRSQFTLPKGTLKNSIDEWVAQQDSRIQAAIFDTYKSDCDEYDRQSEAFVKGIIKMDETLAFYEYFLSLKQNMEINQTEECRQILAHVRDNATLPIRRELGIPDTVDRLMCPWQYYYLKPENVPKEFIVL